MTTASREEQLGAALAAASADAAQPYALEAGRCAISVPLPPGLIDGLSALDLTVRLDGEVVSFVAPLAALTESTLGAEVADTLLRRQFFANQTDGASFALADREDVLVAIYHWMPATISPEAFSDLFGRFVAAALRLRDEATHLAGQGAPLSMLSD